MKRTYENAMKLLDSTRRKARPKNIFGLEGASPLSNMPGGNGTSTLRGVPSLLGMREWLQLLGHSGLESDVNNLNIIHVAGTKGKGSTCAFIRSFLRVHGLRTEFPRKIGLYTSPDLRCIRERIQINEKPIVEDLFTKYFFEVWDQLSSQELHGEGKMQKMPRFLQVLALVAFHTFIREKTEATIFETHHGGEYDATNVVQQPVVTGITSIGLDHIAQLGPSIENVAWHKAGILKSGTPAFSTTQVPSVAAVLQARASEKEVDLKFVEVDSLLPSYAKVLQAPVQKTNCSLALALASSFLECKAPAESRQLTSYDISEGVKKFSWPGRFETIIEGSSQWFLDGAHNELSVNEAAIWFAKITSIAGSHFSEERDGLDLLKCLAKSLIENGVQPQYIIFTTYQERKDGVTRIDKTFKVPETPFPDFRVTYCNFWRGLDSKATITNKQTIEEALNLAREIGKKYNGMQTLVTGSLFMVGGALNLLQPLD